MSGGTAGSSPIPWGFLQVTRSLPQIPQIGRALNSEITGDLNSFVGSSGSIFLHLVWMLCSQGLLLAEDAFTLLIGTVWYGDRSPDFAHNEYIDRFISFIVLICHG